MKVFNKNLINMYLRTIFIKIHERDSNNNNFSTLDDLIFL